MWRRPVCLVNGWVHATPPATSIRFSSRVLDVGGEPRPGDEVIDLSGSIVLPGLINAHDHLELNHFGRIKFRERYENASQWIDDMRPRLRDDPEIVAAAAHSLADKLWLGALKNLLSGVTTVSHHNPLYRELGRRLPVRIVRRFGWAHSFGLEGEPVGARGERGSNVARAYEKTPADVPFILHLAEGVDADAGRELSRLERIGGLGPNTLLVHGVGMTSNDWGRISSRGAGVVWCPASNQFLFGRTASVRDHVTCPAMASRICLGTDSRLSGSRDLLDELRTAAREGVDAPELLRMVTSNPASVLRLENGGRLERGRPADLVVVPPFADEAAASLLAAHRGDVQLVVVAGRPRVGSPDLRNVFDARGVSSSPGWVDGRERLFDAYIARRTARSSVREDGLSF